MSIDVIRRFFFRDDLTPTEIAVGIGLGDSANEEGVAWPAVATIAAKMNLSERTVQNALKSLEGKLILRRIRRHDQSSFYVFNIDNLPVVDRPRRIKERSPHLDLMGAADSPRRVQDVHPRGATGSGTGESPAPKPSLEPEEESPPSPDGEGTPTGDLFGNAPDPEPPSLADYVLARWHELKADEPGVVDPEFITPTQEKRIVTRAAEVVRGREKAKLNVPTPEAVWDELFVRIRASTFLCGRAPPGKGRTGPFKLRLDYALRPSEFPNILNGAYDDDHRYRNKTGFDYDTGRPISSAEQAVRGAIGRLGASGQFRAGRGDPRGANGSGPHGAAHRPPALPGRSGAGGD